MPFTSNGSRKRKSISFGRNTYKRRKTTPTTVVLRGPRPEMKHGARSITHEATTSSDTVLNNIGQGTDVASRIGEKIKLWHITGQVRASTPFRLIIYSPNKASAITSTIDGNFDLRKGYLIKEYFYNPPSTVVSHPNGLLINIKIPGTVCKYDDGTGNNINQNAVRAQIITAAAADVTGYFQVFYTDV